MFDRVGGAPFFERLVDAFYDAVATDPVLRPMYPESLDEPRRHLTQFLEQYWGGPRTYQEERGHPRLRMRHARFAITADARDAWLKAMRGALESVGGSLTGEQLAELSAYFDMAADSLRNA